MPSLQTKQQYPNGSVVGVFLERLQRGEGGPNSQKNSDIIIRRPNCAKKNSIAFWLFAYLSYKNSFFKWLQLIKRTILITSIFNYFSHI